MSNIKTLQIRASEIAELIADTDTEDRGLLLKMVADTLKANTQYYTGNVIQSAAYNYGIKDAP